MSPHPATFRNGTCTGSLWKSHICCHRATSSGHNNQNNDNAANANASANDIGRGNDGNDDVPSFEGAVAEANERQQRTHHEFCVLVGNMLWSYTDVWAYVKGDPPTSEIRIVGASAWNPPSSSINRRRVNGGGRTTNMSSSPLSPSPLSSEATSSSSSVTAPSPSSSSRSSLDFLMVTYSGTHVRCTASNTADKDVWLSALRAGLGGDVPGRDGETLMVIGGSGRRSTTTERRRCRGGDRSHDADFGDGESPGGKASNLRDAIVGAAVAALESMSSSQLSSPSSHRPLIPPPPRLVDVNNNRAVVDIVRSASDADDASTSSSRRSVATTTTTGYVSPCDDRHSPPSDSHCTACGRRPPERAMRIDAAPMPEYGMEARVDLCHDCWIAGGTLRHVRFLIGLYEVEARDRAALRMAWTEVSDVVDGVNVSDAVALGGGTGRVDRDVVDDIDGGGRLEMPSHWSTGEDVASVVLAARKGIATTAEGDEYDAMTYEDALVELVSAGNFVSYRLDSHSLDMLCRGLERRGLGCVPVFLEELEERARASGSARLLSGGGGGRCTDDDDGDDDDSVTTIGMKMEAFKVAGDMSAALRLLYEYALPSDRKRKATPNTRPREDADMLSAILEFFLDLCEQGQVDSVAFYWPQLCHVHRQMLPPRDCEEMIRVELMEDFLLTVSIRFSVHLALDLVWGLTADLEESLGGSSNCHYLTRGRRFAILRFVSELESLLFDFEGGWGGGSVSLRGMLSPSQHQAALLRDAMSLLQLRRRFGSHLLTRSVRLDKLRAEALEALGSSPPIDNARSRESIARNASYFSSHVTFARRLGDIAERLRFMKPEIRSDALREELKEINTSGKMLGGDPLNRLCRDGLFLKTVHIPINEGHVFRSKERTPVLLLVESVKEPPRNATGAMTTQSFAGTAEMNYNGDGGINFGSQKGGESHNEGAPPKLEESIYGIDSPEALEVENTHCALDSLPPVQAQREVDTYSCPESPSSHHHALDSNESEGRLSHGLLTPKTPTPSEDFGKEMMADMIATLIDNQQNSLLPPPLLDYNTYHDNGGNRNLERLIETTDRKNESESVEITQPSSDWNKKDIDNVSSRAVLGNARKISALGTVVLGQVNPSSADFTKSAGLHLSANGQFRRDVLFAIMERGMRGNNIIGKGAATAARRAIQAMDRKRAISLMNGSATETDISGSDGVHERSVSGYVSNDEDKVMEALRLLIIQSHVAKENLGFKNAVKPVEFSSDSVEPPDRNHKGVDAGDVDKRLAGCGNISSSLLSALRLWKGGIVSNGELLELVQKDLQFLKHSAAFGSQDESKLIEDSAFWGRFSFGERWAEKKARLAASSPYGSSPDWDLTGCIVKSNDDLRQEAFIMQLIVLCDEAFRTAGLDLWVNPYTIIATGLTTGIIECVRDAMSFDSLKKRPGYGTDGLVGHFTRMAEIAADPFKALNQSKLNFVRSLAAYSLMSYLFMFKDRHNGNLLLDTAGHVIHIDFGFVFGIAPGGSFSLEQSTPFKLTDEMLEVMGGLGSPLFSEFVTLFCCGFLALQAHADTFLTVVEVTCRGSSFHCFEGKDPDEVVTMLRERFCPELNKSQTVAYALDLIKFATTSYGTTSYDYFQYLSQGIAT